MLLRVDTDYIDEPDRRDFVHEAVRTTLVPCELQWLEHRKGVNVRGFIGNVGGLTLCSGQTTARKVERTPTMAKDAMEPSVFINLQPSGSDLVVQHDREVLGRPGDLVMYDSTSPYTVFSETGVSADIFRIPHSALALPHDMIRDACAVALSPGHPITTLTNDYLRRVASTPALFAAQDAELVARPSIELIRAVITTHLRAGDMDAETTAATLQVSILEYARRNLHDPELSVGQVAAAHYVSVRYLYRVLSTSGISLGDWIRTRRLEACRQAPSTAPDSTTIAAIAHRNGFRDISSFSRSFRTQYGMTPREWRDATCAAGEAFCASRA